MTFARKIIWRHRFLRIDFLKLKSGNIEMSMSESERDKKGRSVLARCVVILHRRSFN